MFNDLKLLLIYNPLFFIQPILQRALSFKQKHDSLHQNQTSDFAAEKYCSHSTKNSFTFYSLSAPVPVVAFTRQINKVKNSKWRTGRTEMSNALSRKSVWERADEKLSELRTVRRQRFHCFAMSLFKVYESPRLSHNNNKSIEALDGFCVI